MKLRFDLLRHGATGMAAYYGSTDVPLTDAGREQMRQAVAGGRWQAVVTSPLRRCAEFAETHAAELCVPCIYEPRLREMHFGRWEGRSVAQLMEQDAETLGRFWNDPLSHPPPEAEPLQDVQARVLQAVHDLAEACAGQHLLLVTHGGPIRILLAACTGQPLRQLLQVEVPHAALFALEMEPGTEGAVHLQRRV